VTGTRDVVTGYSVDAVRPDRLLVTNGNTVKRSTTAGCTWEDVLVLGAQGDDGVPLSGSTSTVVATASLPGGPSLAAVREGTSAASRPHVASSPDGRDGTWRETSNGLPLQGSPRLLEPAGDGRTAYLTISPVTDAGGSGGSLPSVPGVGGAPPDRPASSTPPPTADGPGPSAARSRRCPPARPASTRSRWTRPTRSCCTPSATAGSSSRATAGGH
jgi:hypothetical protein